MSCELLSLRLQRQDDVLLARQRHRQIARLLGYDVQEQALIAAGSFAVAQQAMERCCAGLMFLVEQNCLHVQATEAPSAAAEKQLCLVRPLPLTESPLSLEDVGWAAKEVHRHTPWDWFEEIKQQNQELLSLVHLLQKYQTQLGTDRAPGTNSAA